MADMNSDKTATAKTRARKLPTATSDSKSQSSGRIAEVYLDGSARIECAAELVPAPGQYLLAHADGSTLPLPAPLFLYDSILCKIIDRSN